METFYVVVRLKPLATCNPDRNTRFEKEERAVAYASELSRRTGVGYVVLKATKLVEPAKAPVVVTEIR